jgi:hypothetical protein
VAITWYMSYAGVIPAGEERQAWYGFSGEPYAVFDGWDVVSGGVDPGSMFTEYNTVVSSHQGDSPLSIAASYDLAGVDGTLIVHIEVTDPVQTVNNHVHFVITEDEACDQVHMARAVLPDEPFTLTDPAESMDVVREFTIDPSWHVGRLDIVVFVQSHAGDLEVLQATRAQTGHVATVILDSDPDLLFAAWHLDGPAGYARDGRGHAIVPVWTVGDYTVTWQPMPGWSDPDPAVETRAVSEDATVTFQATYTDPPFTCLASGPLGDAGPGRGVAMVDYDRDGDLDIYVVNHGAPNLLLRNEGGDDFIDVAEGPLAAAGPGNAAAWVDYDNDGDLDLFLSSEDSTNVLLGNDGTGTFTVAEPIGLEPHGSGQGIAWGDYDHDGLVDLYLVYDPGSNSLFRNYGEISGYWFFFEVSGVVEAPGRGFGATWADYDNDGDPDLFVTNRTSANVLLDNSPAGFLAAAGAGVLEGGDSSLGAAWADHDNDGDLDCYLVGDGMEDILAGNAAGGFSLLIGWPLGDIGRGRGVVWGDFDNDADQDLFVARSGQRDLYLRNEGSGVFTEILLAFPATYGTATGAACGDHDGDGDLDLYVACDGEPNMLLRNECPGDRHWLEIDLVGVTSNVSAIGARVRVVTAGGSQLREVSCGSGYHSQDAPTVHFGLASSASVDTLEITWPASGTVQVFRDVAADRRLTVPENAVSEAGQPGQARPPLRLLPCSPNPFNGRARIRFELMSPTSVSLGIFDLTGGLVRILLDRTALAAGPHEAAWDGLDDAGRPVASGTYLCRLEAAGHVEAGRLTFLK